jgi:hypothetical protein
VEDPRFAKIKETSTFTFCAAKIQFYSLEHTVGFVCSKAIRLSHLF